MSSPQFESPTFTILGKKYSDRLDCNVTIAKAELEGQDLVVLAVTLFTAEVPKSRAIDTLTIELTTPDFTESVKQEYLFSMIEDSYVQLVMNAIAGSDPTSSCPVRMH